MAPLKTLALLALVTCLPACGGGRSYDPRLAPLATASVVPGQGLGDLVLGQTTLSDVVARYGPGHVALLAGDEGAIELSYAGGQLDLLFPVPQEVYREWDALKDVTRDLETVVAARPEIASLELTSLSIDMRRAEDDPFFRGTLEQGGRLGGPIEDVLDAYGEPESIPGLMWAGMSPDNPSARAAYPDLGVLVRYEPTGYSREAELARKVVTSAESVGVEVDHKLEGVLTKGTIESIAVFLPSRS